MTVVGFAILFAVAGLISVGLAIFGYRRRVMPGAAAFSATMLLLAVWPLVQVVDVFVADLNLKILLMKIRLDAPAFSAIFSLLMILELTSQTNLITRQGKALLFVIPTVGIVLNWTSPNSLFRHGFYVDSSGFLPVLRWINGPLFWVWIMFVFGLYLAQIYLLIRSRRGISSLSFTQTAAIFLSTVILLSVNAAFQLGFSPIPGLNLTPAAQALMGLTVAWAIFQYGIFKIIPLARATIFEQMSDGIIVLDKAAHIVDINPTAARILGVTIPGTVGRKIGDIFSPWPHLIEKIHNSLEMRESFHIGTGEGQRTYEISLSPLQDGNNLVTGRIIVLHALNSDTTPFAVTVGGNLSVNRTSPEVSQDAERDQQDQAETQYRIRWMGWLVDFFFPRPRTDLKSPPDLSPEWFISVERTFTQVLRFGLLLSPIDIFFSEAGLLNSPRKLFVLFLLEILFYVLAIARTIPFKIRAFGFLFLVYFYGVKEVATLGYSAESFMFFIIFVLGSEFLLRGKSGWGAIFVSLIPLGFFGWQIKTGALVPEGMSAAYYLTLPAIFPIPLLLSFLISVVGLNITLAATWENWRRAWQKEEQVKNLLQQERDLLDQRVGERSRELFDAEAKYRSLVENLPVVVYQDVADNTGATTYVSPQVETMLGYSQTEWEQNPEFWGKIVHPEDKKIVADSITGVIEQGHYEAEYRVIARDGKIVWLRDETILMYDEDGNPKLVYGSLQNISEQRLAGEQLRQAEELFSLVVENIHEVFWLTDPINKQELYISPAAERIWGKSAKELTHNPNSFLESILEEDRPIAINALELQSRGEGTDIKYRIVRPDGSIRWVWDRSTVFSDKIKNTLRAAGFALDITETVQATAALEHSAAQFRELFEDSPVSLWEEDFSEVKLFLNSIRKQGVTDFKTYLETHPEIVTACAGLAKVVNVNQASLLLYHAHSKEELLGSLATVFNDESLPNFILELTNIAEGKTEFSWVGENLTLTDERLIVNVQWSVVAGYEESLSRVIVSIVDITKEKEAEKILKRQSEQYAALSQIAIELLNHQKLDDLLQLAAEKAALLLDAPFCEIILKEDENLVVHAFTDNQPFLLGDTVSRSEGRLSWRAHDTGNVVMVEDYSSWEGHRNIYDNLQLRAVAEFPIMVGKNCIGVLGVGRDQTGFLFDKHHVQLGEWLAQLVALVLNNAQLLETTRLQVTALDAAANAIVITDRSGKIHWANSSFTRLTGYTIQEALGKTPRILKSGKTPKEVYEEMWRTILSGNSWHGEVINRRKDGNTYFEEMTITPLRDEHGTIYRFIAVKQDITSRKQAEQALIEGEERYRSVVTALSEGVVLHDESGSIITNNKAAEVILGMTKEQMRGVTPLDPMWHTIHQDGSPFPGVTHPAMHTLKTGEPQSNIVMGIHKPDGTLTWILINSQPIWNKGITHPGAVAVSIADITERKVAEDQLRASEEKYRLIYENLEDVVYQTDYFGNITAISPSITKQSGYQPEDLIGKSVAMFYPYPEEYAILASLIEGSGSVNDFEVQLKRKDGSLLSVSITARTIFNADQQPSGTEGVMRNISDRKEAETRILQMNTELEGRVIERTAEIQATNRYLTALLDATIILNKSLDLNEVLDHILAQSQNITSCRALTLMLIEDDYAYIARRIGHESLGTVDLMDLKFPVTWPIFKKMITTGNTVYSSDTALDANWRVVPSSEWIRSYVGIPLSAGNKTIGFLNLNHDQPDFFTKRDILLLEALANHASIAIQNARLLEELKSALEKEQGMRDQLVHADKLAALGKMVAVIAHEINNPIQTVKNTLYLIEDQIIPGSPAIEYLKMASTEANRISDLVVQLRETYRARSKTFVRVNLPSLLEEVKTLLAPQMRKNQVEWMQPDAPEPIFVFAIRNNIKQVFINLCMNAIEAMSEENGGQLTVTMNSNVDKQWVGVEFHNTGPLISQDAINHIFEPFFTTKGSGSGLGLSICYDIIKQHSGEITVESYPQTGVIFTVWLSIAPNQETG